MSRRSLDVAHVFDSLQAMGQSLAVAVRRQEQYQATVDEAGFMPAQAKALRFTVDDLRLNRAGRLSRRQASQLTAPVVLLGLIGLCFSIGIPIALFATLQSAVAIFPSILFGALGVIPLWMAFARLADISEGRVVVLRGSIRRVADMSPGGSDRHFYVIGDRRFEVPVDAYQALAPNLVYAVYVTPRTGRLMSLEPLAAVAG